MRSLARALRPLVRAAYTFKRRYRIGERFLGRHPRLAEALMACLRPFKSSSVVDVHGHVLTVDEGDYLGLTINGVYEPDVTRFLQSAVRPGDTALDLGANIGYFTLLLAKLVGPTGRVIAFEPDPTNFRLLEGNVRGNGYENVSCRRAAVADRVGVANLYLNPGNPGDHKLADDGARTAIPVEVVTLDDSLAELRGEVRWIKMDIQGAEPAALRGMRALVDSCPELTLVTELCPSALASFGQDSRALLSELDERELTLNEIRDDGSLRPISREEALRSAAGDGAYVNLACVKGSRP